MKIIQAFKNCLCNMPKTFVSLLIVLSFFWLFTFSLFYLKLQYKLVNVREAEKNLAWSKYSNPNDEYEIITKKDKIGDAEVSLPILLNKRTGITYRYFRNDNKNQEGWFLLSWKPIEEQLKHYKEIEEENSDLWIYLFSYPFKCSKVKYEKFMDDFYKYRKGNEIKK